MPAPSLAGPDIGEVFGDPRSTMSGLGGRRLGGEGRRRRPQPFYRFQPSIKDCASAAVCSAAARPAAPDSMNWRSRRWTSWIVRQVVSVISWSLSLGTNSHTPRAAPRSAPRDAVGGRSGIPLAARSPLAISRNRVRQQACHLVRGIAGPDHGVAVQLASGAVPVNPPSTRHRSSASYVFRMLCRASAARICSGVGSVIPTRSPMLHPVATPWGYPPVSGRLAPASP